MITFKQIFLRLDGILKSITAPGQREPESNGNKGILLTEALATDIVLCYA